MMDPRLIRENIEAVNAALAKRQTSFDAGRLVEVDEKRRRLIQETEKLKSEKNTLSGEIAKLRKSGTDTSDKIEYQRSLGKKIEETGQDLKGAEEEWEQLLLVIPNLPDSSVPVGTSEEDNKVVKTWGEKPSLDFEPKAHWNLGESLDILDFKRAAKITGSRFTLYKSQGALLERALINFMLDLHVREHGYVEVLPPFMVNRTSMTGTGQLPKFEEELFHLEGVDYFLIPTAEVPVTNIHATRSLKKTNSRSSTWRTPPASAKRRGHTGKIPGALRGSISSTRWNS